MKDASQTGFVIVRDKMLINIGETFIVFNIMPNDEVGVVASAVTPPGQQQHYLQLEIYSSTSQQVSEVHDITLE